jgi:serine/threonine-protein kinase HipA
MTDEHEGYSVLLGDELVGTLALEDDTPTFRFHEAYCERSDRPILSLSFEDEPPTPDRAFREEDGRLPRFFRNLLPEGHLLEIYERQIETMRHREFELLALIGEDLPGAVRVVRDPLDANPPSAPPALPHRFAFGLAGVQFKLQAARSEARLTIPARGQSGQFIAKFGSPSYPELVQNEWAMLEWARLCGLDVPSFLLRHSSEFDDPSGIITEPFEGRSLLVERFDRDGTKRIHQEDFAQVLSLHPEQKYDFAVDETVHYTTIGNIVANCGANEHLAEYVERLVFMVLSGNCDAHTKNWAITHNGHGFIGALGALLNAKTGYVRLSPLYDVVSTIAYPADMDRQLALSLSGELRLDAISRDHILELCARIGVAHDDASAIIAEFCKRARATWADLRERTEVPTRVRRAIDDNLGLCAAPNRGL